MHSYSCLCFALAFLVRVRHVDCRTASIFQLPGVDACSTKTQQVWYIGSPDMEGFAIGGAGGTRINYEGSAAACAAYGATLPVFYDQCEYKAYVDLLTSQAKSNWIGYIKDSGTDKFVFDLSFGSVVADEVAYTASLNDLDADTDMRDGNLCIRFDVGDGFPDDTQCNMGYRFHCRVEQASDAACAVPPGTTVSTRTQFANTKTGGMYELSFEGGDVVLPLDGGFVQEPCADTASGKPTLGYVDGVREDTPPQLECAGGEWSVGFTCLTACRLPTLSNAAPTAHSVGDVIEQNATVTYECNDGFAFSTSTTSMTATCLTDGNLDTTETGCSPVCDTSTILNAAPTNPADSFIAPPATIEFTCTAGYVFAGVGAVKSFDCGADGVLVNAISCEPACSAPPPPVTLATADPTSADQYYAVGESLTAGCAPFYTRVENGVEALQPSVTITCTAPDTWYPVIECVQFCDSLDDSYLHNPAESYLLYYESLDAIAQGDASLEQAVKYRTTSVAKVTCTRSDYELTDETTSRSECVGTVWTVNASDLTGCRPEFPMNPAEAAAARTVQVLGCSYVLGVLGFSLFTFFAFRQFDLGRLLQFMEELSLFVAHAIILTLRDFSGQAPLPGSHALCTFVGLSLQYFFCVHFTFLLLESLHVYSSLTNVNSTTHYFSLPVNLLLGWVGPLGAVAVYAAFARGPFYSTWSCWLNYGSRDALAVLVPVIALTCGTLTLGESVGVDSKGEENLPLAERKRIIWARFSRVGTSIIAPMSAAAYFVGSYTVYKQRVELYVVVLALNITVGVLMWKFHAMSDAKIIVT